MSASTRNGSVEKPPSEAEIAQSRSSLEKSTATATPTATTTTTSTPPPLPPPPPNGGLQAWLQIVGAHFLFFNSWGVVLSFGAFESYYTGELLKNESASNVSWIGTIAGFLLIGIGIVTGPIFDQGYFRTLVLLGSFLTVFGIMMTSISTQYYQVFLAQGVCAGIGAGCLFLPSIGIAATYFSTKRAFATGLTAAGGSLGGVIYPIVFKLLLPKVGFGWATRVIGFISLATLMVSIAIMKPRLPPPAKARALFDASAWKSVNYDVFSAGLFLVFTGLYLPFFFLPTYASVHLGLTDSFGFYLVSILNAASVFGRIIPGLLADKFGSLNLLTFATIASGIVAFGWIGVTGLDGIIVFCLFYGFLSGAVVSLPPTVVAGIVPDLSLIGTWMGMSFSLAGLGLLIGNPIAGVIINVSKNVWLGGQLFGAFFTLGGGLLFLLVRLNRIKDQKSWKM